MHLPFTINAGTAIHVPHHVVPGASAPVDVIHANHTQPLPLDKVSGAIEDRVAAVNYPGWLSLNYWSEGSVLLKYLHSVRKLTLHKGHFILWRLHC